MMSSVEFFFDYGSPYSYLADSRLEGLRQRTGAEIVYRPMLLGGVFKATGNRSPFLEPVEAKQRYFSLELRRTVARLGVAFKHNPNFPINTLGLMRAAYAAQSLDVFPTFHLAIYLAFWTKGADLGQGEVIEKVLSEAGLEGREILELSVSDESKGALRATTDEAVERGVFGAPTFFVGGEMFFGNDRMDLVEEELAGREAK
ncbi:MAG TPA: 2-hydroxychromene-2-carboxylate isomerase [Myxococcales bacterium]|nr:2-hydroxychromene-2-carboxylate isomerase [Myxococcales bacterium]HIK84635.1 2-hydroxychromene-2-carboxylate isomerase [Myxococcales bacterium]